MISRFNDRNRSDRAMSDYSFYPMPTAPSRTNGRWLLLLLHGVPFTALVYAYPWLAGELPEILVTNSARLIIPAWAGILIIQLLIAVLIEIREGRHIQRLERERSEYISQSRRAHLAGRVSPANPEKLNNP